MDLYARHSLDIYDAFTHLQQSLERAGESVPPKDIYMEAVPGSVHQEGRRATMPVAVTLYDVMTRRPRAKVKIDLVVGCVMTAPVESRGNDRLSQVLDVQHLPPAFLYPVVDHIADKVAATMQTYVLGAPSTRVRDLVDILILAQEAKGIDIRSLYLALESERQERNLPVYTQLVIPESWTQKAYAKQSQGAIGVTSRLSEAIEQARAFIDPVMQGMQQGIWNGESWV